jgi:hypothetical protein
MAKVFNRKNLFEPNVQGKTGVDDKPLAEEKACYASQFPI